MRAISTAILIILLLPVRHASAQFFNFGEPIDWGFYPPDWDRIGPPPPDPGRGKLWYGELSDDYLFLHTEKSGFGTDPSKTLKPGEHVIVKLKLREPKCLRKPVDPPCTAPHPSLCRPVGPKPIDPRPKICKVGTMLGLVEAMCFTNEQIGPGPFVNGMCSDMGETEACLNNRICGLQVLKEEECYLHPDNKRKLDQYLQACEKLEMMKDGCDWPTGKAEFDYLKACKERQRKYQERRKYGFQ